MRLKSVRITGFKTFADKTELSLDGDLIAVVGPNGCGKSNIVDAILWGLGEPNARQLRAQNALEVIFSGSAHRKAQNFAEVSLYFDNEDGSLPINLPEVVATRRVNRQGESEYEINKQRCRQKDIHDLFADSGLGKSGYSIVGQKDIDSALSASADERRGWIDEAAGVQRYRQKKLESLRRLRSATEHLERVDDIILEISTQIEPLMLEAEAARKYKTLNSQLREIESGLLIYEVQTTTSTLKDLEIQIESHYSIVLSQDKVIEELEVEIEQIGKDISETERALDAKRELHHDTISRSEKLVSRIELYEDQKRRIALASESVDEEKSAESTRKELLEFELVELSKEKDLLDTKIEANQSEIASCDSKLKKLLLEKDDAEKSLETAKNIIAKQMQFDADVKANSARQKEIERELIVIAESLPSLEAELVSAEAEIATHKCNYENSTIQLEKLLLDQTQHKNTIEANSQSIRKLLQELGSISGKRQGIEATLELHEGLSQGSFAVYSAVKSGLLPDEYVTVGDAINSTEQYALAIETALGGAIHDIIVREASFAKRAIEYLKENRLGRATFQPIPLMKVRNKTADCDALLKEEGVLGLASEFVQYESNKAPVIESLLGSVLIVKSLSDGLKLAKTRGWSKLVSIDGEVIYSSGAVAGGVSSRKISGVVSRKAELNSLEERSRLIENQVKLHREKIESSELALDGLSDNIQNSISQRSNLKELLDDQNSFILQIGRELKLTLASMEKLHIEKAKLMNNSTRPELNLEIRILEDNLRDIVAKIAVHNTNTTHNSGWLKDSFEQRENLASKITDLKKRVHQEDTMSTVRNRKNQELASELESISKMLEQSGIDRIELTKVATLQETELKTLTEVKRRLLERNFNLSESLKRAHQLSSSQQNLIRSAELSKVKVDSKRANSQQRLLEEYGISEEEALLQAVRESNYENTSANIHSLRREIRSMGEVNLGAIEGYERLKERFDELTFQKQDILDSKAEIDSCIHELDKLTRDKFLTTFEKVQEEFQKQFTKLFNGGEGRIFLTQPESVLDSGIEIEVQVTGKKRQRLELLSGGERALCALAFLFALLKVSPSPLVILDEVDAPLDGRNVERYLDGLAELSGTTQFICITHNPTTIETAPIWFGVTMQEAGVSSVIPYRASDNQKAPQLAYMKG